MNYQLSFFINIHLAQKANEREGGRERRERKRNLAFRFENKSDDVLNTSLKKKKKQKTSRKNDALSIHNALALGHRGVCVYYFSWKRLDLLVFRNSWKDQAFAVAAATPGDFKNQKGRVLRRGFTLAPFAL